MRTPENKKQALSLFFAGLLPVIAFTVIEEYYGILYGLIVGMIFGLGEIIYELIRYRNVQKITWIGNGALLVLGGASLIASDGIWFKLQPALMEGALCLALLISVLIGKPLFSYLAEQQGQSLPKILKDAMVGLTLRTSFFFAIHTGLAIWAAFTWSTTSWALLKGMGLTVSFILYLIIEAFFLRRHILKNRG